MISETPNVNVFHSLLYVYQDKLLKQIIISKTPIHHDVFMDVDE